MLYHLVRTKFSREFLYYFTVKKALACSSAAITLLLGCSVEHSRARLEAGCSMAKAREVRLMRAR